MDEQKKKKSKWKGWGSVALAAALLVAGLGLTVSAGTDYAASHESASWPTTAGTVVESDLREISVSEPAGRVSAHNRSTRRGGSQPAWVPRVRYEYTVGERHVGEVVDYSWHDTAFSTRAEAQAALRPYPLGARVDVHYDPESPDRAVLETTPLSASRLAGGGALVVVAALAFFTRK